MLAFLSGIKRRIEGWLWPVWPTPSYHPPTARQIKEAYAEEDESSVVSSLTSCSTIPLDDRLSLSGTASTCSDDDLASSGRLSIHEPAPIPTPAQIRPGLLKDVEEIRIGGGAARGYAAPGTVSALEREGGLRLDKVKWFTGISIGSLVCLGLALGMRGKELRELTMKIDGARLRDSTWRSVFGLIGNALIGFGQHCRDGGIIRRGFGGFLRGLGAAFRYISSRIRRGGMNSWGFCEGEGLRELVEQTLQDKIGIARPTFAELAAYNVPLRVVTAQVCCSMNKLWSAETTPDACVVDVMLASMAVPVAFHPYQDEMGHVHADGGIRNNIPPRDPSIPVDKSLILRFTDAEERRLASEGRSHRPIHNLLDFVRQVLNFGYGTALGDVDQEEKHRAVHIQVDSIRSHEFGATAKQRLRAHREGVRSARKFLDGLAARQRQHYPETKREQEAGHMNHIMHQSERATIQSGGGRTVIHLYEKDKRTRARMHRQLKQCVTHRTVDQVHFDRQGKDYRTTVELRASQVDLRLS